MLLLVPWYAYALISAVLVGIKSVLQKAELKKEHSLDYTVAFSLVAMIVALFLWPWVKWGSIAWESVAYVYAASLFGSVAIWMGTKAVRHLELSLISPQTVLSTLFTLVFAHFFLGDILTIGQIWGAVILVVGGALLAKGSFMPAHHWGWVATGKIGDLFKQKTELFYEALLLGSMVLMGFSSVFDKFSLARLDVVTFLFLISIFLFVNHFVLYLLVVGNVRQIPARVEHLGWLLVGIAIIATVSRLAYSQALSMTELSLVTPIKHSAMLVTTLIGGSLFKEKDVGFRAVIALVMLIGVWLLVR
ncbi:EamA family transporter [Patescibacteria group bacterium]|nr:EamA family transporter [Patescibacteria group bacterium]